MNKTVVFIATGIFSLTLVGVALSKASEREREKAGARDDRGEYAERTGWRGKLAREDVAPVTDDTYREECGACHLAYQPGLLPARDWRRVMASLDRHYGEDATLDGATTQRISDYLESNAADRATHSRSRAFAGGDATLNRLPRIINTDYFKREHHEIPARMVTANEQVKSYSQCQACHRDADAGVYNEHGVQIPGFGAWDD